MMIDNVFKRKYTANRYNFKKYKKKVGDAALLDSLWHQFKQYLISSVVLKSKRIRKNKMIIEARLLLNIYKISLLN